MGHESENDEAFAETKPATDTVAVGLETLPFSTEAVTELPLVEADRYGVVRELGRGGMGRVLVASDQRLRRVLALKISLSTNAPARMRFAREALLTARLQHPSIVPVHEAGTWEKTGEPFYAMKLVDGQSLDALVAKTTSLDERLALLPNVIAVVDALAFAHAQRIIHRDLKPSNVIVGDFGETIVIDWGLAKELDDADAAPSQQRGSDEIKTVEGSAMGTPPYMAPEQVLGERVDERADVYGLGAMLYHVLCGAPPYRGVEIMTQVLAGPPPRLATRMPGIPRDLLAIVDKAMARGKAERYANAGALGEDLKRFVRGQLVAAHAYSRWELVVRWLRKHRAIVTIAALAVLVLGILGTLGVSRIVRERNAANAANAAVQKTAHQLLLDTGRSELELEHPLPAARALARAYAAGDRDPATLVMLAAALRPLAAEVARYDAGERIYQVRFSADGESLVTLGDRALLWDTVRGTRRPLDVGTAAPLNISVSGARVAVGLDDGTARIFDVRSGTLLATLAGQHTTMVRAVLSPDGARVVTAGMETMIVLWDAADGTVLAKRDLGEAAVSMIVDDHFPALRDDNTVADHLISDTRERELALAKLADASNIRIAFHPDGRFITASIRGQVAVWSRDAELLGSLYVPADKRITEIAASENRFVLAGNGYAVMYSGYFARHGWVKIDRTSAYPAKHLAVDTDRDVTALAISRDIIAAGDGAALRTFDTRTGTTLARGEGDGSVVELEFAGELLIGVGSGRFAQIRDARGGPVSRLEGAMRAVAVAGDRVATPGFGNDVWIWKLSAAPTLAIAHADVPAPASFAPDGQFALVDGGQVRLGARTFGENVRAVAVAPDGRTLVTLHAEDRVPRIWRDDGTLVRTLEPADHSLSRALFVAGGTRVVGTSTHGGARRAARSWDLSTGALAGEIEHTSRLPPSTTADGRRYVTFGSRVVVWDAATSAALARFERPATHAALSPDGARVAIANEDGSTQIYDVATQLLVETLVGHAAEVLHVEASATGFVTASRDGTARVWTGARSIVLAGHRGHVTCAKVSPDGAFVATGGDDGTLRIWDPRDGRQLLAFDNGAKVVAIGFSPASDAVFATTTNLRGGRTVVFALRREARTPSQIEQILDASAR